MISAVLAGLARAAGSFFIKMLTSFASEKFIKWVFFYTAEQVVKSTKTDHDNKFLEKAKQAYEEYDAGGLKDAA